MRYYAAPLARFVSVDPLQFKYPFYTPFQYAGNKPVSFIDLDGAEEWSFECGPMLERQAIKHGIYKNDGTFPSMQNAVKYSDRPEKRNQINAYTAAGIFGLAFIASPFVAAEFELMTSVSWRALPVFSTITAEATSYYTTALVTEGWKHLAGGTSDLIGQVGVNMYMNKDEYGLFSFQNMKESFLKINRTSILWSTINPTNSFETLAFNGLMSNTFQTKLNGDSKFGTMQEVFYGTMAEISFGILTGKFDGGMLNISNSSKELMEMNKTILSNKKNYTTFGDVSLFGANDKIFGNMSFFTPETKGIHLKIDTDFNNSRIFENLNFGISSGGQLNKNLILNHISD